MSNIPEEYEMEAGTSGLLETCDESRMLIEAVGTIAEKNSNDQGENYFVVTEVNGEQTNLIQITGAEKLHGVDSNEQNQPWGETCRICANDSDHLIPIFKGEGLEHELGNKIHKYLPIQVSEEDNLPLNLCYHCAATLLAWHELAEGCLDAEQRLLRMQNEVLQKHRPNILDESLDVGSATLTTEDTHVSIKNPLSDEVLEVKGECNEESDANDSERSLGEECTVSLLQIPKAEIEESSYEERLEYVECGECDATFIEFTDLAAHMNSEHNDFVHYCSHCKIVYRGDVEDFKQHEKKHDADNYAVKKASKNHAFCSLCNEEFSSVAKLKQHLLRHINGKQLLNKMEPKSYTCNSCDKSFSRKFDLKRHINMHENVGYIENNEELEMLKDAKVIIDDRCLYKCNTCGKHIITKRGFLRHIRIHTGNRPCRCNICGNQYRIKQDLARHIRDVHDRIKKYLCKICARPFANKGAKEDHQRIHTGERPYSCKLCKKTFRTLNSIYIHNRIHTNYKPHKCPSCDKQFPSKQRLNNHLTTHTGVKEFSCEICFKLFSVKGEVVRHRAIHSQDKPFVCLSCGMKFGQKRYLRNHIKQHHKEQSTLLLAKLTAVPH